jgi:hypothetical protein
MFLYIYFNMQISIWTIFAMVTLIIYQLYTFYLKDSLYPFDIPAGIYNYYVIFDTFIPVALQSGHGCLITSPIPLHLVHYKCITIELCLYIVEPEPPHAKQRVGAVPD